MQKARTFRPAVEKQPCRSVHWNRNEEGILHFGSKDILILRQIDNLN
jgi:hypothetical protein